MLLLLLLASLVMPAGAHAADPGSEPHSDTGLASEWATAGLPGPGLGISGGAGLSHRPAGLVPLRLMVAGPAFEMALPCGPRGAVHLSIPLAQTIAEAILVPGRLSGGVDLAIVAYRRPRRGGFDLTAGPGLGMRFHTNSGMRQLEGRIWGRFGVEAPGLRGRFRVGVFLEPWFAIGGGSEGLNLATGLTARALARWHWVRQP